MQQHYNGRLCLSPCLAPDQEAQHHQAEQRQQHFEQSPGGRAAKKAMADVAKDRQSAKSGAGQDNARDWLS